MKKITEDYPELAPSQILKDLNIPNVPMEVAAHLPDIYNIKQTITRHKSATLPANPQDIDDLELIPRRFSMTKEGDFFFAV